VVMATSPFDIEAKGALSARKHDSGLNDWLAHNGITLEQKLVLDPQNSAFPIPVNRHIGGFTVQETRLVDYPYFVDIRSNGMDRDSGLTSGLDQITMTWPSPIDIDATKNKQRKVTRLLRSSDQAWTSDNVQIQPDFNTYGKLGFPAAKKRGSQLLAVALEGRFDSYFKDKPSPLAATAEKTDAGKDKAAKAQKTNAGKGKTAGEDKAKAGKKPAESITRVIDRSPESARIILFASNSFLSDDMMSLASAAMGTRYIKPVELVENAVDWSLEDRGLLAIRGRAQFSRTLYPMNQESRVFWEYLNYGLALFGLLIVWLIRRRVNQRAGLRYAAILGTAE
jgi:ABC-2 type transport system permease protein